MRAVETEQSAMSNNDADSQLKGRVFVRIHKTMQERITLVQLREQ